MDWKERHFQRVAAFPEAIREAHAHASCHRPEVEASARCGCFHCLAIFSPGDIRGWVDADSADIGQTALCPRCGIDSVIGSGTGFPIEAGFLEQMRKYWF